MEYIDGGLYFAWRCECGTMTENQWKCPACRRMADWIPVLSLDQPWATIAEAHGLVASQLRDKTKES